jgi:Fe-Mn family superoxide dismutase
MLKKISLILVTALSFSLLGQSSDLLSNFLPLPYDYAALEPHIDSLTMQIHYDKHHRGYFNNLQSALQELPVADKQTIEQVLGQLQGKSAALRNNAGGHFNHAFFWKSMSPKGGGEPKGILLEKIKQDFASVAEFRQQFKQTAMSRFGSGWAWLCLDEKGKLFVSSTANQDNPLMDVVERKGQPILALDVWEHAYYLKYQNLRGSYIDAFWEVVDWEKVRQRMTQAIEGK